VEVRLEHHVLVGTWRRRTYMSSGEKVRRLCPQLSGPGRTPRDPEAKGEITVNLAPIRLDTLAGGIPSIFTDTVDIMFDRRCTVSAIYLVMLTAS
jgi:hypothetical protein